MVFHGKLSTAMPPPEVCIGLAVTLAYDLLPLNVITSALSPNAPKL